MKLFLSLKPKSKGGGSHTFASHFGTALRRSGHTLARSLKRADVALVIAHWADPDDLARARERGCFILHRLDEYFEADETAPRREKHGAIIAINRQAHVTIYQSDFVRQNVSPHLAAGPSAVIRNGGDPETFFPASAPGPFIGHVTWGVGEKKRLDRLHDFIRMHPEERFLLVGRHAESGIDFRLPHVELRGALKQPRLAAEYRRMKMLYFPSEKDPCPNTAVEAILSGVPVAYEPDGGTVEIVKDCGLPLAQAEELLVELPAYRTRCLQRPDLDFASVFQQYLDLIPPEIRGQ